MSDFPPDIIIDANGDPVGRLRANQDPSEERRLHPVPRRNARGEVILDGEVPDTVMLPLSDQRTVAQLATEGLKVAEDGATLIAIEGHPDTDIQPTDEELALAKQRLAGEIRS